MTQSWRPERDWSDPDSDSKWLDKLLSGVELGYVTVRYELVRWEGEFQHCWANVDDSGACGKKARYVVLTRVVNSFKGSKRERRSYACSLRHINKRVREYFGIDGAAMDIDERMMRNGKV